MTDIKKQVQNWLDSGKDYDQGVFLLAKHSPQKILVNSLVNGNDNPIKIDKLLYELTKLAGLESQYKLRSSSIRKERKRIKESKAQDIADRKPAPKAEKEAEKKDKPKETAENNDSKQDEIREITEKTVLVVAGSNEKVPFNKLPLIIQEVMKQKGNLYRERDQFHDSLKAAAQDNKPANIEARALIAEKIAHISERIDILYQVQKSFEENSTVPDESILNWDPEPAKPTPKVMDHSKLSDIELKNRQSNVRGSITKTKNMIAYQKPSMQKKANPMPEGPKLEKYKSKLEKLTFELEAIEKDLEKRK